MQTSIVMIWACSSDLRQLKFLHLQWTCIGDGELAILSRITAIEELELTDTKITDTGLASLVRLSNLKTLCVGSTHITSAGMSTLRSCRTLEQLDVSRTTVDDRGLQYLADLTHLRVVNVQSTCVTETGVAISAVRCHPVTLCIWRIGVYRGIWRSILGSRTELATMEASAVPENAWSVRRWRCTRSADIYERSH